MQLPVSDNDFYQRKIARLQSDIATLHTELNNARTRLRSAQDYQIKYQLLLRQSNQQNQRLKMIEQIQRSKFLALLQEQVQKIKQQCQTDINKRQLKIRQDYQHQIQQLKSHLSKQGQKNNQLIQKAQQAQELLLKNRRIAKDLESLQQIIYQNRQNSQKQKQNQLKILRQSLTKKYNEKAQQQRQQYEQKIDKLLNQNQELSNQLDQMRLITERQQHRHQLQLSKKSGASMNIMGQLQRYKKQLQDKHDEADKILTQRITHQKLLMQQTKSLKQYIAQLQQKLFNTQKNQSVELLNLKTRMIAIKQEQLANIQRKYQQKQQLNNKKIIKLQFQLEEARENLIMCREKAQKDLHIAHQKFEKQCARFAALQDKNREYEHQREIGQTQNLIHSLRQFDYKQDQNTSYENGITFLQRQIRRSAMKLQKKNIEVKQLVNQLNDVRAQCQREIVQLKQKYYQQGKQMEKKIIDLEDQVRDLYNQIRSRDKSHRQRENQLQTYINKSNAQARSLRSLNNDLQRDYNRVLESKKNIQKSFREQRQRSVTSKSQIAVTKKNKFLQLQKQKNSIQIIYKGKQQQLKMKLEGDRDALRVQRDKLKQQLQIIKDQYERLKANPNKVHEDKENINSEFNKKIAAVNLEIALTQNLYKTLVEARSRTKIQFTDQIPERVSQEEQQQHEQKYSGQFKINDSMASSIREKQDKPVSQEDCATPFFANDMMMSFKPQK